VFISSAFAPLDVEGVWKLEVTQSGRLIAALKHIRLSEHFKRNVRALSTGIPTDFLVIKN
jgi:hypothetical protein